MLCDSVAAEDGGETESAVDATGYARSRDEVAVDDDALIDGGGSKIGKEVEGGPMGGGAAAFEEAGGAENQSAGADGEDVTDFLD